MNQPPLLERILDYPYHKWFGWQGRMVIACAVIVLLFVKFITGLSTATLEPTTCEWRWYDRVYWPFNEQRIVENTKREIGRQIAEKSLMLQRIKENKSPYGSSTTGNVISPRNINNDKLLWRALAKTLAQEREAMSRCAKQLSRKRY